MEHFGLTFLLDNPGLQASRNIKLIADNILPIWRNIDVLPAEIQPGLIVPASKRKPFSLQVFNCILYASKSVIQ